MFAGKPIIGIAGGIGSGKSFIAGLFAAEGCAVIDSDAQVRLAYADPVILATLRGWWGDSVFRADGSLDRSAVARRVFSDPRERERLEGLLHPWVARLRQRQMETLANESGIVAFVWDTPLLFEAGLNAQCDAVVFVETPVELRLNRVMGTRGWTREELQRREILQWPLDRKRQISDDVIQNTADVGDARRQVRAVLSRILARVSHKPEPA
jgi:dephospho-CoA kinase